MKTKVEKRKRTKEVSGESKIKKYSGGLNNEGNAATPGL